jgi:hypothetical protein
MCGCWVRCLLQHLPQLCQMGNDLWHTQNTPKMLPNGMLAWMQQTPGSASIVLMAQLSYSVLPLCYAWLVVLCRCGT